MKKALITGITGQDGSYLAEFLLGKGYEVHGMHRPGSDFKIIKHLLERDNFFLHKGDLTNSESTDSVVKSVMPDEVYNLGAQTQVSAAFDNPHFTREVNFYGVLRLVDAVRKYCPNARFFQASTCHVFAESTGSKDEESLMKPASPYAQSKLDADNYLLGLRKEGFFVARGILFNHESPRRGEEFVTRKITSGLVRVKKGMQDRIELGNLDYRRDWGFAGDYVEAMWMMLQEEKGDDFVIATGQTRSVRELVEKTCEFLGIDLKWEGTGIEEKGVWNGKVIIRINKKFFRPTEANELKGNFSKASVELGWRSRISFSELVKKMVESDLEKIKIV